MYVNTELLGKLLLSRDHNSAHYIGEEFYRRFDVKQEAIKHYLNMVVSYTVSVVKCTLYIVH